MNVYVVTGGWSYEGDEVIGVAATEEEAKTMVEIAKKRGGYDVVNYEIWEVGIFPEEPWA